MISKEAESIDPLCQVRLRWLLAGDHQPRRALHPRGGGPAGGGAAGRAVRLHGHGQVLDIHTEGARRGAQN